MFKNYLLLALRLFRRHRLYTAINAFGMTVGLACVALVVLYTAHEASYDRHHPAAERTFQVNPDLRGQWYSTTGFANYGSSLANEQLQLAYELEALPGVDEAALLFVDRTPRFVETAAGAFEEEAVLWTNTPDALTSLFAFDVRHGHLAAFTRPDALVLTASTAQRYFGSEDVVGRALTLDDVTYDVVAVVDDPLRTSHLAFNLAIHVPRIPNWGTYAYVRLAADADPATASAALSDALDRANPSRIGNATVGASRLLPITSIHFSTDKLYPITPPGDRRYLVLFAVIGLLILGITAINYTNLAVALYASRQKEIGVRKALGADRRGVATQFLTESVLLAALCLPVALALLDLVLPAFNRLMDVELANRFLTSPGLLLAIVALAVGTGLLAGAYPAFLLARKQAIELFGRGRAAYPTRFNLRKGLVVAQFALLIGLGSLAVLMHRQLTYVQARDLGVQTDGLVELPGVSSTDDFERLKTRLGQLPGVEGVSWGGALRMPYNRMRFQGEGQDIVYDDANLTGVGVDWFDTVGLDVPDFERWRDAEGALPDVLTFANETAADRLGWTDVVGKTVVESPGTNDGEGYPLTLYGVVPDVHLFSLHEEVRPLFISVYPRPSYIYGVTARVEPSALAATLPAIEAAWADVLPTVPFRPLFADETLAQFYAQDRQAGVLSAVLTSLAVALAALGLFGLSAYLAGVRRKEIGVRKVMGASASQMLVLLNREFVGLVGVAFVLAVPLAWLAATTWLDRFAYRITVGPGVFLTVGLSALAVALLAVSYQTLHAAHLNPADVLRDE